VLVLVLVALGVGATACSGDDNGGRSHAAVEEARKATEKNPNDAQAWRKLATALRAEGVTADAVAALDRYTELRPKDADALRSLGILYIAQAVKQQREQQLERAQTSFEKAATTYRRLIALQPNHPSDHLELGLSSEQAGHVAAAITAYRTFLRLAPRSENAAYVRKHIKQLQKQAG
jgi:Flp pilus assembly protein TadD